MTYTIFPILQSPPSLSEFAMALFFLLPRGSPEKPGARFGTSGYDEMADESWFVLLRRLHLDLSLTVAGCHYLGFVFL